MSGWTDEQHDRDEPRYRGGERATAGAPVGDPIGDAGDDPGADPGERAGHHLPAGAHLSDRRGLTATGAVAVALALGTVGGAVDVLTGPGLRTVFAVCFVLGCAIAALAVHREDLIAAVVIPPLVYCVLAVLAGTVEAALGTTSMLTRQAIELLDALVLGAPVLLTATGAALVIALVRGMSRRHA